MPTLAARALVVVLTAAVASLLGWAGLGPLEDASAWEPVWWPLSGFGAVLLVFASRRFWPWIVAGLALGSSTIVLFLEPDLVNLGGLVAGLVENVLIALLLRRLRPRSALDESLLDTVRVLVSVLAGSAVASVAFAVVGASSDRTLLSLWSEFTRNHLLALMLVSPCLAVSIDRDELLLELREHRRNLEWLAQLGISAGITALVFLTYQGVVGSSILVLPLIWGALRLGPLRTMITLLVIATLSTLGTNHGLGSIAARGSGAEEVLTLQVALGVLALTTMVTSVVGRLRERAMALVEERTGDLNMAERVAGMGSARWDPATGRTIWSEGLHLLLGTDPGHVRPSPEEYLTRIHPDDLERVSEDVGRLAREGRAYTLEYRIVRDDGETRDVVLRTATERRPRLHSVFTVVQDVTQARAAAAEVRRAHDELAAVLDAVTGTAILGVGGPDGLVTFFNIGAENLFGYRADEVIGKLTALQMHAPDEHQPAGGEHPFATITTALDEQGAYSEQRTFLRKDGSMFPGQLTVTAQQGPDGRPLGFIGVITDLSRVLTTQEELAESEKRFRLAFDTSPMGMAIVSLEPESAGRLLRVNGALSEFAGISEERMVGAPVGDFLRDGGQLHEAMANIAEMVAGQRESFTSERHLVRPDGGQRWGRISASAVRPDGDREPYLIMLVEDITARKELTERLQHEAAHDSLTGLPNRLHLHRQLERELRERHSGHVAVLYLDLEGSRR